MAANQMPGQEEAGWAVAMATRIAEDERALAILREALRQPGAPFHDPATHVSPTVSCGYSPTRDGSPSQRSPTPDDDA